MSVEGLLCEVKNFKPKHLTVALGDQLYFGGQRIYSDFKPTTSTSNNKKEGKKDGKASGKKDPLNAAINNAKNIANKALSGKGDNKCMDKVSTLEKKVESLTAELENMKVLYQQLVDKVEACAAGKVCQKSTTEPKEEAKKEEKDDDFDLFGSDDEEEDEEKKKIVEERLKAYAEKKSKKPGPIAKSSVILDVKTWDDETDIKKMEECVRGIEMDGLVWGGGKLIPVGYGIQKLQIICVIEDAKVSVDDLIEKITEDFEEYVQSVDIVAFNKI